MAKARKRDAKGIRHGEPRIRTPEEPEPETRGEPTPDPEEPEGDEEPLPPDVVLDEPEPEGPTRDSHPHLFWPRELPPGAREVLVRQLGVDGVSASGRPVKWLATRPTYPCPECDRIYTDDLRQAVLCYSGGGDLARMVCRACGHQWKMPRV